MPQCRRLVIYREQRVSWPPFWVVCRGESAADLAMQRAFHRRATCLMPRNSPSVDDCTEARQCRRLWRDSWQVLRSSPPGLARSSFEVRCLRDHSSGTSSGTRRGNIDRHAGFAGPLQRDGFRILIRFDRKPNSREQERLSMALISAGYVDPPHTQ